MNERDGEFLRLQQYSRGNGNDAALRNAADEIVTLKAFIQRMNIICRGYIGPRPTIVCLCGSTLFWREFQKAGLRETLAGRIVLSIGAASGTDDEHFGNLDRKEYDKVKERLDELHLRKIDLADEVLILNVGGYVGESTRREYEYAVAHGKRIRWLEPEKALKAWERETER